MALASKAGLARLKPYWQGDYSREEEFARDATRTETMYLLFIAARRDLDLDRDLDRDLARDLNHALALARDLDRDLAFAFALTRDLARDLNPELERSLQQLKDQLPNSEDKE